jgi:hypothetical protein
VVFAGWVNQVTGGEPGCALLDEEDVPSEVVRHALAGQPALAVWARSAQRRAELCGPVDLNIVEGETVVEHVRRDIARHESLISRLVLLCLAKSLTRHLPSLAIDAVRAPMVENSAVYREQRRLAAHIARSLSLDVDEESTEVARGLALAEMARTDFAEIVDLTLGLDAAVSKASVAGGEFASFLLRRMHEGDETATGAVAAMHGLRLQAIRIAEKLRDALPSHDVLGNLGEPVSNLYDRVATLHEWQGALVEALVDHSHVTEYTYTVTFDDVRRLLVDREFLQDTVLNESVGLLMRHLVKIAIRVLDRRQELTTAMAAGIRLAALCAAGDPSVEEHRPTILSIAAAMTLLERRIEGTSSASETIILAVT